MPTQAILQGTLRPDGTLELDQKPNLPPGRVTVLLQAVPEVTQPAEGWWPYLQRVRAEREAAGYHFMNEAEMHAHIEWLREDEDRIDRIRRQMDMEKRSQEKT